MFLAGDIGGTKTVLAIFESSGDALRKIREETFPSQSYTAFDTILGEFLEKESPSNLRAICLGVAGTVIDGRSHATNLPWNLDEAELAAQRGVPRVKILNDLEAAAYGVLHLRADQLCVLQAGSRGKRAGNVAVIAAGTGLGEAMLYWDGAHYQPIASEGGHADFGPTTRLEAELWEYLSAKFGGHVSWERVLSGPGVHNIYSFLRDCGHGTESREVEERMATGDPNAAIAEFGLAGTDPLCVRTLEILASIYGAEAGNMALRYVAYGGVIVAGGVAPKLLPALQKGEFTRAFSAKGRLRSFLETIEVSVALDPRAPLIGAAHYAMRL